MTFGLGFLYGMEWWWT